MTEPAKRNATYDDLKAAPPHLTAELLFGSLETHPRPSPKHAIAAHALGGELSSPFQKGRGGPGGWVFMIEPELHLGPHVLVPDLTAWRRERMPHMPPKAYVETAPDWACEVLSPSTEATDRGPKRRIYATYGVGHLWHLDPVARLLEVFALREGKWVLFESFADGDEVKAPPFEAVPFQMADLWPLPSAPETPA